MKARYNYEVQMRRLLTLASGGIALAATGFAFHFLPVDLSSPIGWLWTPLFGGTVFINVFGISLIALLLPWEIAVHYMPVKASALYSLELEMKSADEISSGRPAIVTRTIPEPLRQQVA